MTLVFFVLLSVGLLLVAGRLHRRFVLWRFRRSVRKMERELGVQLVEPLERVAQALADHRHASLRDVGRRL